MARNTSYHGWSVPETGDTDYEDTFDVWFDDLDVEIIEKDTIANQPAAGTSDRWFLAHDEPALYYDNGSSWSKVAGLDATGGTQQADDFQAAQGTGTPYAYHFADDTNTGFYRSGTNALTFGTGGTDALTIDSAQNVDVPNGELTALGTNVRTQLVHEPSNTSNGIPASRNWFSDDTTDIYVDPAGSDSTGDGTSGSPYATLQYALKQLPYWITHTHTIHLADGTYTGEPSSIRTPPLRVHGAEGRGLVILGNRTTPGNVVIDSANWFSLSAMGAEPHDGCAIRGVTLNCKVQAYNGVLHVEDCVLNSDTTPTNQTAIAGYASSIYVNASEFGGNATHAIGMREGGWALLDNCTGSVSTAVMLTNDQSNITLSIQGGSLSGALQDDGTGAGIITQDGEIVFPDVPNSTLTNDSVTVAGNNVALGGSTGVATGDLSGDTDGLTEGTSNLFYTDERAQDAVGTILGANFTYDDATPSITLTSDTVTIAGNSVALGGSTAVAHADLSSIGAEDHHSQIQVSDSGTAVLTQPTDINFASNLTVTDDTDGTVTIDASGGSSTSVGDDEFFYFGADNDYGMRYETADDRWHFYHDPDGTSPIEAISVSSAGTTYIEDDLTLEASALIGDNASWNYGDNNDFRTFYRSSANAFIIEDETNNVDLALFPKSTASDPTVKLRQGISVGSADETLADDIVVNNATVTLSSGSAVVSTGVTSTGTMINVFLDPSGNGNNAADVKASARAFWDNSAGEYKVEILEDGTSVGNPDIGVKVVTA